MAAAGEIGPMPIAAVFADTQAEPKSVYVWLDWLEKQLPFPVIRATAGNLAEASTTLRTSKLSGNTYLKTRVPYFALGADGKKGMNQRHCTRDYKINVVRREVKKIMKAAGAKTCKQWIGISTDEAIRMKPSGVPWAENVWPLIDHGISRQKIAWIGCSAQDTLSRHDRLAPSAPITPIRSGNGFKMKNPKLSLRRSPMNAGLTAAVKESTAINWTGAFLHSSRVPLDQVVFADNQPDLFGEECEGMCGV